MKVYYDYNTKNESFIKLGHKLNSLGIQNKCFLSILNTDLIGVDPHDPNLTEEQKRAIFEESSKNPWYFFREVMRIPIQGGYAPFEINLATFEMLYFTFSKIPSHNVFPRQHYRSTTLAGEIVYFRLHPYRGYSTLARDTYTSLDSRCEYIIELLPKWYRDIDPIGELANPTDEVMLYIIDDAEFDDSDVVIEWVTDSIKNPTNLISTASTMNNKNIDPYVSELLVYNTIKWEPKMLDMHLDELRSIIGDKIVYSLNTALDIKNNMEELYAFLNDSIRMMPYVDSLNAEIFMNRRRQS